MESPAMKFQASKTQGISNVEPTQQVVPLYKAQGIIAEGQANCRYKHPPIKSPQFLPNIVQPRPDTESQHRVQCTKR